MFLKRTVKHSRGKTYTNYLLVESVATARGPRHRVICSLGALAPAPREQWLALAHHLQGALAGQGTLWPADAQTRGWVEYVGLPAPTGRGSSGMLTVDPARIEMTEAREAGAVHVGHQVWLGLQVDRILGGMGFSEAACLLTEVMTLNRLIAPAAEYAMPDWIRRTALADVVPRDLGGLQEDRLYRHLDRLYPRRVEMEQALVERERSLFGLEESLYLYDLTSSYFEGQALANPKAKRGYSRDKRPDCKQVVVGLVLDGEGFPKAHEVFAGNRADKTTVADMLAALERRTGKKPGATVIVDRGMAYAENLVQIRAAGYHYLVAGQPGEREDYLAEMESEAGWEEVVREPSPRNEGQKKVRVMVKRSVGSGEAATIVLCWSEGRTEKDRAIRRLQESRLVGDLEKLSRRIARGRLRQEGKIHQAIGRLRERYGRVARYYELSYDPGPRRLSWQANALKQQTAEKLDGTYLLKSSRRDWSADQLWRTYMLLTRVEAAFRNMKSPLMERPIFHQLERRVETHIFLCVLAYHLLVCIERAFLDRGIHTSWATLREQLATHQVVTVCLPTREGPRLLIRRDTKPEESHRTIYETLGIPERIIHPLQRWER